MMMKKRTKEKTKKGKMMRTKKGKMKKMMMKKNTDGNAKQRADEGDK